MRSEGFPFIGGGLGVGPVFASSCSCRRDRRVNSVPMGKVATGVILSCLCFSSGVAVTMVEAENASFLIVSQCQNWRKSRTTCSFSRFHMSPLVSLCLSSDVAVTMVEAAKRVVFDRVKVSKLEEVSYEMLVLTCLCASFVVHSSTGTSFVRAL